MPRPLHPACLACFLWSIATQTRADETLTPLIVQGTSSADDSDNLRTKSIVPAHFPGSATVIGPEKIANSGARSVADLLTSEGGLILSSTSGNASDGQVQLRGFGENAASRVLILIDGQPLNRPDMASISWQEIPLSRIERIEILRGSQTARFGDNAVGGVINLITRGGGTPKITLETAGGDDGSFIARAGHSGTYAGQDLSFDLERNVTDGWRENSATEVESASGRWKTRLPGGQQIQLGLGWTDQNAEFPGPLTGAAYRQDPRQSIYTRAGVGDEYFSEQNTWRADASILLGIGEHGSLKIPIAWSYRDQHWNFGAGSNVDNQLDTITLAPEYRYEGDHWSATLGARYRRDDLDLQQYAEQQRLHRTGQAGLLRETTGAFSSVDWEPWRHWHLSGALRYDASRTSADALNFSDPGDPALNFDRATRENNSGFQLGLRWEPQKDVSTWLRYDRLYRLPSTDEIASYQGYPLSVPFNDQLHAERGHNIELGAEYSPGGWDFRLNGFAQWLEGEIAYDYLRNLNVNFARTRRIGIEADAGYRTATWEAKLHTGWLDARYADGVYDGHRIYLVPQIDATALLACHPVRELTLQGECQYVGSEIEGNDFAHTAPMLPAHTVANAMVRYRFDSGLSLYCRVNNLLDERYATVKYSGVWYPAAGRQFLIGLRQEL